MVALAFQCFQLFLVAKRIRLDMEHAYELVLLMHVPDLDAVGYGFVREVGVVAFSNSDSHSSKLLTLMALMIRPLDTAAMCRRTLL
ncbi:Mannose-1-phosphate guanylyltransferase [Pseudomonas syringae pv. actinidiae]|uniref:Mannose-1-phosphate guanylyltransferase n=1 Tax=Pseudomonas syringae pv. actinidiae TaxID=103796 RepID=A0A2V0QS12_PSESF|nr:Mannose-1-phosphate guanylyltransferase [Pseudomonas syringae pv. actinidiae]